MSGLGKYKQMSQYPSGNRETLPLNYELKCWIQNAGIAQVT